MLDAIGIASNNIEKSIKFYNLLGLDFKEYGEGHFEASCPSGIRLMIDSYELLKKINPEWKEPKIPGITLCFKQETSEKVDELFNQIKDAGFTCDKEPWDAFWGQRYASVKDPNGNNIDIFANLS